MHLSLHFPHYSIPMNVIFEFPAILYTDAAAGWFVIVFYADHFPRKIIGTFDGDLKHKIAKCCI